MRRDAYGTLQQQRARAIEKRGGGGGGIVRVCIRMDCRDKSDRALIGQWQNGTNCNFCRESAVKAYRIQSIWL